MAERDYEAAYLATIKNPLVYQDDLEASARIILRDCVTGLAASRASLWLLSEGERNLKCLALYDQATGEYESGSVLSEAAFPKYFEALYSGRIIDAVDASTDPRTSELRESYLEVLDVQSLCDATIRNVKSGDLHGVLCVEIVGEQRNWSAEEKMFVTSMSDLLSQRLITSEWAESEKRYEALYESTTQAVMVFGDQYFADVNPAACDMFGAEAAELIGLTPADLSPEFQPDGSRSSDKSMGYVAECLNGGSPTFDWVHRRVDGTEFDAELTLNSVRLSGADTLFAHIRDVTAKKAAERAALVAQEEVEYRAAHDSLTGLLNREQLFVCVDELIEASEGSDHEIALLLLDLNRFKEINDTLGHSTGDRVLVKVADVLKYRVYELGGLVFRLGGDEFVAVFDSNATTVEFDGLFGEIRECLASSIDVGGVSVELGASIGASVFPHDGDNGLELLRCADVAMYHGKNNHGSSPWYSRDNDLNDKSRLSLIAELRQAIRNDELVLHYQPRISLKTGELTGCEALVRWEHPERGLLPPGEFLALAEMTELIHPLTEWVVNSALDQLNRFASNGYRVPVAINLSARNLADTHLFDVVEDRVNEEEICPKCLEVEITESALINNPQRAIDNLNRLEKLGVSIAIDDFGTGYSSLSLLKELPLDTLKIDRSFVNDMLSSPMDHAIVSSTLSLAHNFSATVIAEGVEDQATLDALRDLNCDEAQGYFIARPMPIAAFEQWVAERVPAQRVAQFC